MQRLLLTALMFLQTIFHPSPPEPPPLPRINLQLTPTWNNSIGQSLQALMTISDPAAFPSTPFLQMTMESGRVPSMNYTGAARIRANDDLGAFELEYQDVGFVRIWYPERKTQGDVELRFEGTVRYTTKATPPGPRIDIRENSGGLLGTGNVFIPTVLSTDKGCSTRSKIYNLTVSWDLSSSPEPSSIKTVWSFGEGLNVNRIGPSSELVNTVYGVAPSSSFHSYTTPSIPGFGVYWFTPPPPSIMLSPADFAQGIAKLFPLMSSYFEDPGASYRVFLRQVPRGHGGGAYDWSFILEWDEDVVSGDSIGDDVNDEYFLVSHEMAHNWPLMESLPGSADPDWYNEGIATYYESVIPYQVGAISQSTFLNHINQVLSSYYTSPAINMSLAECAANAWSDNNAQRCPYYRGAVYLLHLEAAIVAKGQGRTLKEPVLELLRMKRRGNAFGLTRWTELMKQEGIDDFAAQSFNSMSAGGWLVPIPAGIFGPKIVPVKTRQHVFQQGYVVSVEADQRVVRNVVSGSRAELAGINDGDLIVPGPYSSAGLDDPNAMNIVTLKKGGKGEPVEIHYSPRSWDTVEVWQYRLAD